MSLVDAATHSVTKKRERRTIQVDGKPHARTHAQTDGQPENNAPGPICWMDRGT